MEETLAVRRSKSELRSHCSAIGLEPSTSLKFGFLTRAAGLLKLLRAAMPDSHAPPDDRIRLRDAPPAVVV